VTRQTYEYFSNYIGIDPANYYQPHQRTFGPFQNPNGSPVFDGDESGFTGFTQNNNPDSSSPIPQAENPLQLPYPLPGAVAIGVCDGGSNDDDTCDPLNVTDPCVTAGGACRAAQNTIAGPVRNYEIDLVTFEGQGGAVLQDPAGIEYVIQYTPGKGGNRWQVGLGFWALESASGATDYGIAVDDAVFEWRESHPVDEAALGHTPACDRFGGPNQPAGGQCASLTTDRTTLYECDEAMVITVYDAKCRSIGAGNTSPLYGPCTTHAQCGAGGVCSAALDMDPASPGLDVQVQVVTDSDSVPTPIATGVIVDYPNSKLFTLPAVAGSPGLYRGTVVFSTTTNDGKHAFTSPGTDGVFSVYYHDPIGDCDGDGQAAEDDFNNVDGDGCPGGPGCTTTDNCPQLFNPAQTDSDGDGFGTLCDNCPTMSNASQADANADGVGDDCDFDDIDADGASNEDDNCPDVFNGQADSDNDGKGNACDVVADRDGDGVADALDNCVLAPNANQANADGDTLGDACDGDCVGAVLSGRCYDSGTPCVTDANCALEPNQFCQPYVSNSGTCSLSNDDVDADGNSDDIDNCPTVSNPEIIAGTGRQRDRDRDGIGEECDPTGSQDDAIDGIPDDVVTFNGTIACRSLPLAQLTINSVTYQDYDGDHDSFPDTGEFGRVQLTITNGGPSLTDATLVMTTTDPDVACITKPTLLVGVWPTGQTKVLGDFVPGNPGFEFKASPLLNYVAPPGQAIVSNCLTVIANETLGMTAPVCFNLVADSTLPGGPGGQTFVKGPDGLPGTADDGVILENFDIDKNGDGVKSVKDAFLQRDEALGPNQYRGYCSTAPTQQCQVDADCPAGGLCYTGAYIRGSETGVGLNVVAGIQCGGFDGPAPGELGCRLDPDYPMDWHYHCPNGAANCPNVESGSCFGGCTFNTPLIPVAGIPGGLSGATSLHMGAHFDPVDNEQGDGSHFRTLQAFMTAPINLALFPAPGQPLEMSFFHIARLVDNNAVNGVEHMCADCGDVQFQLDIDPDFDPNVDQWGIWDKLVPSQNVYDKKTSAFSNFGVNNCEFTPTDTGTAPPNPNGVHETMCFPQGVWARCGHTGLGAPGGPGDCAGPAFTDPGGTGRWVQTKFNLAQFQGLRIRIRWIGQTWEFNENAESYFQLGSGWNSTLNDDGWWLDDIRVQGAITQQFSPRADTRPDPGGVCPAPGCNEAVGPDNGTSVLLQITDVNLNVLDGVTTFPVAGQPIRVSAINSVLTGGCVPGVAEFQFFKDGVLKQDWGPKSFFLDAPEGIATYQCKARCSVDFTCTSAVGASIQVQPVAGDGSDAYFANPPDANLGFRYYRGACTAGAVGAPCNSAICAAGPVGTACTSDANCGGVAGACAGVDADCGPAGVCGGLLGPTTAPANNGDDALRVSAVANSGPTPGVFVCVGGTNRGFSCVIDGDCPGGGTCDPGVCVVAGVAGAGCAPATVLADCGPGAVCNTMKTDLYSGNAAGMGFPAAAGFVALANEDHFAHLSFVAPAGPGSLFRNTFTNVQDPVPASGSANVYFTVGHAPGGAAVNALSCPNLGVCNNAGWCNLGANAGAPCNVAANCPGGACVNMPGVVRSYCTTDTGMGDLGGCGRHSVCVGGATPGKLCLNLVAATASNTVDCGAGGTCSAFVANAAAPGQLCLTSQTFVPQLPFNQGCLPVGHVKRLIGQAPLANVCP
jgi:hypothetical protein